MESLSLAFVFSLAAAVITGIFTVIVFRRWWQRRRPHLLAWAVGLLMYFLGTLSQVVLAVTWSPLFFGLWYWAGALMVAPWLGQGTAYLLIRRGSIARNIQMALILVGVMTLPWTLFLTPFNEAAWQPGVDITTIYRDFTDADGNILREGIMTGSSRGTVRFFSPIMNIWGTLLLVGGALYSARLFRRKQIMRNRVVGNWLIAAGALLPALAGALIRLDLPYFKYFAEMAGAVFIFAGFLYATRVPEDITTARDSQPLEAGPQSGD